MGLPIESKWHAHGFIDIIKIDFMSPAMIQHLQRRDFTRFAGLYNGSGQKEKYGRWIKNHYQAFKHLL